jgi:hypothetical protein
MEKVPRVDYGLRAASCEKENDRFCKTANLERVLKQADLVKFAKSKTVRFRNYRDRNKIQKAILTLIVPFR